jgi:hypothetical protein
VSQDSDFVIYEPLHLAFHLWPIILKTVGYASYLFLKTFIEDFTGLSYGWVWLKIVEITFLSLVTCYPLLEAVNLSHVFV